MSYSLVFTRNEIPIDDQEALDWIQTQFDSYYEDDRPAHPKFKELHDSLTSRYPCICELPDDDIDDGVWSDGPLINNFSHDLAMIAVPFSRVEEVIPFTIQTAISLGCSVLDLQSMEVHRPIPNNLL